MQKVVLVCCALAAGCSSRTEIVLGAATDLKARNQLDEVRLIVSRNGVPVLQPKPWTLSDVPAGVYELPGSFGLYSPDGSEVKLDVQLQGFKNLQPVIREKPSWVIAIPEDVVNERVTDLFTIMVKQENDSLQLHYGNTTEGQFYLVTFTGVTKEGFIKSVMEIIQHIYGEVATASQ